MLMIATLRVAALLLMGGATLVLVAGLLGRYRLAAFGFLVALTGIWVAASVFAARYLL